jgi:uncharacterized membrane protein
MKNCSKCGAEVNEGAEYCKKCGNAASKPGAGLDEKKARVFARDKKWVKTAALAGGVLFAALALWVFYTITSNRSSMVSDKSAAAHANTSDSASPAVPVKQENGEVRISIADLDDRAPHFYVFQAGGKDIRFFLLRDAEGGVRAALDACHNCFRAKRGYRQEGNTVICNNCGMSFKYENIGIVTGGCNPIPLPRKMDGQVVVLKVKDLEAGAKYF